MFNDKYDKMNRVKHTIFGAFVGDALGCTLEFKN